MASEVEEMETSAGDSTAETDAESAAETEPADSALETETAESATEAETDEFQSELETDEDECLELDVAPASPGEADMDELLKQLEDYTPTVPDALTQRILNTSGFGEVDPRIVRIISVSAQKFISDIANDALQHCKTRTTNIQHSSGHNSNKDKKNPIKDRKYALAMEDLLPALADHGITMRKPQYFV